MLPYTEFRILDINAESLGVPTSLLMENAGKAVAKAVSDRYRAEEAHPRDLRPWQQWRGRVRGGAPPQRATTR